VTVAAKLDALERVGLSKAEVRDLIQETSAFISGVEATLREGPLSNRQAALRRCVSQLRLELSKATAMVRAVPVTARDSPKTEALQVDLASAS
jgi:hypothetical protein